MKKGAKVPRKRTTPVCIFYDASDWVLLAGLNSDFCFSIHIVFTQRRPDIIIFSDSLGKVILFEITCPCEDNMKSWHGSKINKYLALKTIIVSSNSLFYTVLESWVSISNLSGTLSTL